jgi:hypothetical protein
VVHSDAATVKDYLASLPEDRRKALSAVRTVIRKNLPTGVVETMNWGMISYEIPLSRYPVTYNGQPLMYAALASQKNYMALYMHGVYGNDDLREQFEASYRASGKKLDMGKGCVRFTTLDALPLDVIGEAIGSCTVDQYLERYEKLMASRKSTTRKPTPRKTARKQP